MKFLPETSEWFCLHFYMYSLSSISFHYYLFIFIIVVDINIIMKITIIIIMCWCHFCTWIHYILSFGRYKRNIVKHIHDLCNNGINDQEIWTICCHSKNVGCVRPNLVHLLFKDLFQSKLFFFLFPSVEYLSFIV